MRHILLTCLALPLLGGCMATTLQGFQKREPAFVGDSQLGVTEVSRCISAKWITLGASPQTAPTAKGVLLYVQVIDPLGAVSIEEGQAGTHVIFWRIGKPNPKKPVPKDIAAVRDCL